jgi:hypothetical protein
MSDLMKDLAEAVHEAYWAGFIAACKWPEPVTQDADSPAFDREFHKWNNEVRTHHATIQQNAEEVKILRIKAAGTLANNLCPDHRDKQVGKPCLACEIEKLEKAALRLRALEQAMDSEVFLTGALDRVHTKADELLREWAKAQS